MSKELAGQMKKLMKQSAIALEKEKEAENKRPDVVKKFLSGMTLQQFNETVASKCESKQGWLCVITKVACKDYMCPKILKTAN